MFPKLDRAWASKFSAAVLDRGSVPHLRRSLAAGRDCLGGWVVAPGPWRFVRRPTHHEPGATFHRGAPGQAWRRRIDELMSEA